MSQRRNKSRNRSRDREYVYVQGNTVLSPVPSRDEIVHEMRRNAGHRARVRRNRERAGKVTLGYALFLALSFLVMALILIGYLDLKSDITARTQNIATLKNELNNLKLENDERYERLTTSIDLNEVRKIAESELNMSYAGQGQIQVFSKDKSDYVHQLTDLPDGKK